MGYRDNYQAWLRDFAADAQAVAELKAIEGDEKEIEDRFYRNLSFGTAGMRGVLAMGMNRMNVYTVRRATQGLSDFLSANEESKRRGVVIAYDSRRMSREFAEETALVLCANGVHVFLFDALRPVPILSYAVRHLHAAAGVVITASHNPPQYNGYKVYAEDGAQISPEVAAEVTAKIDALSFTAAKRMEREAALESGLLNPKNLGVNIKTLLYQVPGGMLSNLTSQLKEQHAEDKFYDVLEEVPKVRKDLGEPPLVTPSSQIVGTQAVFNVLMGEIYKMVTKETKDILLGKYGATVKPFNPEVQKKCIGDAEPITCRPADLIDNELDKLEKEVAPYKEQDEDVLSYALFPQVATDFFKYRQAQEKKVDEKAADTKNGAYPV